MDNRLVKTKEFKVGGWARSKSFGTRVYRVINIFHAWRTNAEGKLVQNKYVTLQKTFETNRGQPIFTNCRPFTIRDGDDRGGTLRWYYPAESKATMPYYTPKKFFRSLRINRPSLEEIFQGLRA